MQFGIGELDFKHVFCCEIDGPKREFLMAQHPDCDYFFTNAADLQNVKAFDAKSKTMVAVPYAAILFASFSCKSSAPCNQQRAQFRHAVQRGVGETGETFNMFKAARDKQKSVWVCSENVVELDASDDSVMQTDAEFIVSDFKKNGCPLYCYIHQSGSVSFSKVVAGVRYTATHVRSDAVDGGSPCDRQRLYFHGFYDDGEVFYEQASVDKWFEDMFSFMKVPELPHDLFFDLSHESVKLLPMPSAGFLHDPKFKLEHLGYFNEFNLTWPVDFSKEQADDDANGVFYNGMTKRGGEVAFFCNTVWPNTKGCDDLDTEAGLTEYIDVGKTIPVLLGGRTPFSVNEQVASGVYTGPWKTRCCTLTSITRIAIRRTWKVLKPDGSYEVKVRVRIMTGKEVMSFIGWAEEHWVSAPPAEDVCWSLAGNAMSGFALIQQIFAGMGVLGSGQMRQQDAQVLECSESVSSSDDDSD